MLKWALSEEKYWMLAKSQALKWGFWFWLRVSGQPEGSGGEVPVSRTVAGPQTVASIF